MATVISSQWLVVGSRWSLLLLALFLCPVHCGAGTRTLNVTDFGARGDAVSIVANTITDSPVITVPANNALSGTDIGKLMLLFGAGSATTPTNHQDLIATIQNVTEGTNITLSLPSGATSNDVFCTYGTQNIEAFQNCVDTATGTNAVIIIPAGKYLLVPPTQVTNVEMKNGGGPVAAVVLRKGGLQFQGAGMARTILTGCGAWKLQGKIAQRGQLFVCQGPVTNNYPLAFADLTMDGGVAQGNTTNHGFPANVRDGSGWDETHDAVVDSGRAPLHQSKEFRNCRFTHWRGEMLKSVASGWDGDILVTNCVFDDGNASAFNFSFTHTISGCTFSNLYMAMEFYEGYCSNACYFEDSTVTRISGSTTIALVGALTNHPPPTYTIRNNHFEFPNFGILTTPAQNLRILNNAFDGGKAAAALGVGSAGYQGTGINSNIEFAGNSINGMNYAVEVLGSGENRTDGMLVVSNKAMAVRYFAGGYGWSTNVIVKANIGGNGVEAAELKGQWFWDDLSNQFPAYQVYARNGTNLISYAHGARQEAWVTKTNLVFMLEDAHPEKIPAGAVLEVREKGSFSAPLFLSTVHPETSIPLQNSNTISCAWSNGAWRVVSASPRSSS